MAFVAGMVVVMAVIVLSSMIVAYGTFGAVRMLGLNDRSSTVAAVAFVSLIGPYLVLHPAAMLFVPSMLEVMTAERSRTVPFSGEYFGFLVAFVVANATAGFLWGPLHDTGSRASGPRTARSPRSARPRACPPTAVTPSRTRRQTMSVSTDRPGRDGRCRRCSKKGFRVRDSAVLAAFVGLLWWLPMLVGGFANLLLIVSAAAGVAFLVCWGTSFGEDNQDDMEFRPGGSAIGTVDSPHKRFRKLKWAPTPRKLLVRGAGDRTQACRFNIRHFSTTSAT